MYSRIWTFIRQTAIRALLTAEDGIFNLTGGKLPRSQFGLRAKPHNIGTNVKIIGSGSYSTDIAKFNPDGTVSDDDFVIVSTTDFHFDEDPDINTKSVDRFIRQVSEIKPDLIKRQGTVPCLAVLVEAWLKLEGKVKELAEKKKSGKIS